MYSRSSPFFNARKRIAKTVILKNCNKQRYECHVGTKVISILKGLESVQETNQFQNESSSGFVLHLLSGELTLTTFTCCKCSFYFSRRCKSRWENLFTCRRSTVALSRNEWNGRGQFPCERDKHRGVIMKGT